MKTKQKTLSKQDKIGLDLLKSFYNFSHYNKTDYLKEFTNKTNFRNNQNYVLGKNLKNAFLSAKNITENGRNMIGYQNGLKIQEIDIDRIKSKRNNLKILIFGFAAFFILSSFLGAKESGDYLGLGFVILFFILFVPLWFINIGGEKNFTILRNKNKLIVIRK